MLPPKQHMYALGNTPIFVVVVAIYDKQNP